MSWMRNLLSSPLGVAVAVIFVASSVAVFIARTADNASLAPLPIRTITTEDHTRGNPDAPIQMIVFTDTECPYCKEFHRNTLPALERSFPDDLYIAYRHFPLDAHTRAPNEAAAAECAYEQGGNEAFWEYMSRVFEMTKSKNNLEPEALFSIAGSMRLDMAEFAACVSSGKTLARVEKDKTEGISIGLSVTPSAVLMRDDGTHIIVAGNWYLRLADAIDYLLD
jgi:protein-disulfide isomerase